MNNIRANLQNVWAVSSKGDKFEKFFKPAALNRNFPGGIFENFVMTMKRYFPLNFPFRHVHGTNKEHQIKKAKDIFKELY